MVELHWRHQKIGVKKQMNKVLKEVISASLYVLGILILTYLVIHFVGQRTEVSGNSMLPTLSDGDNLIVDKVTYRFHDIERFDIVVFPPKDRENTYYIKRVIGLPGETVYIDENGDIFINGALLEESFGREVIAENTRGLAQEPITLEAGEYFVLGDNRNNSTDSRSPSVGNVKGEDIIGRAFIRIYPFGKFGSLKGK